MQNACVSLGANWSGCFVWFQLLNPSAPWQSENPTAEHCRLTPRARVLTLEHLRTANVGSSLKTIKEICFQVENIEVVTWWQRICSSTTLQVHAGKSLVMMLLFLKLLGPQAPLVKVWIQTWQERNTLDWDGVTMWLLSNPNPMSSSPVKSSRSDSLRVASSQVEPHGGHQGY